MILEDFDNDGDNDLYIVSGGNEFEPNSPILKDRLYINNGKGSFNFSNISLPDNFSMLKLLIFILSKPFDDPTYI